MSPMLPLTDEEIPYIGIVLDIIREGWIGRHGDRTDQVGVSD